MRTQGPAGRNVYRQRRLLLLVGLGIATGCQSLDPSPASPSPVSHVIPANASTKIASPDQVTAAKQVPAPGQPATQAVAAVSYNDALALPIVEVASSGIPQTTESLASSPAVQSAPAMPLTPIPQPVVTPATMTLESIEAIALGSHPAISEARARVQATRGQYLQAGLPFNPVMQYQSEEVGNEQSSGLHSVTVSQQIVTANKLGLAQQVQAQAIQRQQAELRIAELQVLTRIRAAFAQAIVAQRRAQLADQLVELAEKSLQSVQALLDADEVSKIALLQADVEAEQARITAVNAAIELRANLRTLAAAAGIPDQPLGPLAGEPAEHLVDAPWETLAQEIAATSPELAAAGSELERARWALRLACAQITPNVTGQMGVGYDAATDDTFAVVGISVPLPLRNRNQGNIRTARANIAAASAAIERTQLSLDGRLAAAVARYETARNRYERFQNSVIPNAEETFELSRKAFEAGETDFLQLLTAQRTLFTTRLSILDALAQANTAIAEIEGLLVTLPN